MIELTLKSKVHSVSVPNSTAQEGRSNSSHAGVLPSIREESWVEKELKRSTACTRHCSGATERNGCATGQAA